MLTLAFSDAYSAYTEYVISIAFSTTFSAKDLGIISKLSENFAVEY